MIDIKKKAMRRSAELDNIFCISFLALFLLQWIVFWVYANFNSAAIACWVSRSARPLTVLPSMPAW